MSENGILVKYTTASDVCEFEWKVFDILSSISVKISQITRP